MKRQVWDSHGDKGKMQVWDSHKDKVKRQVGDSHGDEGKMQVWDSHGDKVKLRVWDSHKDEVKRQVRDSHKDKVKMQVWDCPGHTTALGRVAEWLQKPVCALKNITALFHVVQLLQPWDEVVWTWACSPQWELATGGRHWVLCVF